MKKIKAKLTQENIKGILFAFLISFSIWVYSLMNSHYNFYFKIPLKIIAPEKFSISGRIPEELDVLISATGWQILNLSFLPKTSNCTINLNQNEIVNNKIILTKNDFLKNIQLSVNAQALDVNPSTITLDVGTIVEKVVPIVADVIIHPRENFILIGKPIVKPDLVVIRGRKELIDQIDVWKTKRVALEDVFEPLRKEIPLSDTLRSQISLSTEKVTLLADVDLQAEKEILDIPISIEGGSLPSEHIIEPKLLRAVIRTGINKLIQTDIPTLEAKVSYQELINDTTGIITPRITLPDGFYLVSLNPPFVYHWKRIKAKMISQR